MADMDQDGYWYRYLAARHDTFLYLGLFCLGAALISALTGKTIVKFRGIVSRDKEPKDFWQNVVVILGMGVALIGLFIFGPM
jgi:hypothetical protein